MISMQCGLEVKGGFGLPLGAALGLGFEDFWLRRYSAVLTAQIEMLASGSSSSGCWCASWLILSSRDAATSLLQTVRTLDGGVCRPDNTCIMSWIGCLFVFLVMLSSSVILVEVVKAISQRVAKSTTSG